MLLRLFPWIPDAQPNEPGGPLFVPRLEQGAGRHDNPDHYGALYLSRSAASPVAEKLRALARRGVAPSDLMIETARSALVAFEEGPLREQLVSLDEPTQLAARGLRPSGVATTHREVTQEMALSLFEEGHGGFEWWSTIESSWINVTLFAERIVDKLVILDTPEPLTPTHVAVREAADMVGIQLPG